MGKAVDVVTEGFLEEVATGKSSGSLSGPKPYVKNHLLVIQSPLPPVTDILGFNHTTPLTLFRKGRVPPSLHGSASADCSSPYRENSYSAFKTLLSSYVLQEGLLDKPLPRVSGSIFCFSPSSLLQ